MPNAPNARRRRRPITRQQLEMMRAQRAAESALGEPARLAVWTPFAQMFTTASGKLAHVWTMAGEYRVEVPAPLPPQHNPNADRRA